MAHMELTFCFAINSWLQRSKYPVLRASAVFVRLRTCSCGAVWTREGGGLRGAFRTGCVNVCVETQKSLRRIQGRGYRET